jgi:hypothetical protein
MIGLFRVTRGRAFRRMALPLVSYYAVTLVLPLGNGAARSDGFVQHAVAVLAVPPIAIVMWLAVTAGCSYCVSCVSGRLRVRGKD